MALVSEWIRRLRQRIVREMIGRYVVGAAQTTVFKSRARVKTYDETIPDYEFWDKLRRGKAKGYTLGGLFSTRIERIFSSWVLGRGVELTLAEGGDPDNDDDPRNYTDGLLADLCDAEHALLMRLYRDMLGLGDQYVVVNADGSLSVPSPDTVNVERDELDYREVLAVEVQTRTGKYTIIDRYEPEVRTVTVKEGVKVTEETQYENLIGQIPVVHLAHDQGANETNGHPIHEALRPLYDEYDDTIYKQLGGAKILGNPLLTFEGMEDISQVINANEPAEQDTYTDKDGSTATRTQLNIDQNAILLVGKGGSAKFTAPPTGFTADTQQALKTLFLLLLDHTGIPEFIWGNQVTSGRSSTEVQMTQWVRDIEGRQKEAEGWLLQLAGLWLATMALTDPHIVIDDLAASWPALIEEDEALQLDRVKFAEERSLITRKTALEQLHLVADAEQEVADAEAQSDARREQLFPAGDTVAFQRQLTQAEGEE